MSAPVWQAVARSRDLGRKPRQVMHDGLPVVLFRGAGGIAALQDRCPHRLIALSKGRVVDGSLECAYHGWRFDGQGTCVALPGHVGPLPACRVRRFAVCEARGGIFISSGQPDAPPYVHAMAGQSVIERVVTSSARSTLIDVAENILDATHTHFTHKGLLRGMSSKRYRVDVAVTGGPGWVEACYTGEDQQHGLVSQLLEGARLKTIGRYRHPGIAELEYWGPKGMVLATTFHLRQTSPDRVEGIGWLVGPRSTVLDHIKALFFKPFFSVALEQDRRVLRGAFDNAALFEMAQPMIGPLDFLRRDIAAIAAGDRPPAAEKPRHYQIDL